MYYLGYSGDGHFGRLNLTTSFYAAFGEEENGVFSGEKSDIEAYFFAIEPSMDFDWIRARLSFLYGSGDDDPFDDFFRPPTNPWYVGVRGGTSFVDDSEFTSGGAALVSEYADPGYFFSVHGGRQLAGLGFSPGRDHDGPG